MKNKKAILMPETLKIIIAVMCLLLLAYLSINLYGVFAGDRELEKVKNYANELEEIIEGIKEGESDELMILGLNDWAITGWPFDPGIFSGEKMPEECIRNKWNKCICFCGNWDSWDNSYSVERFNRGEYKNLCDEKGVCFDTSGFNKLIVDSNKDSKDNDNPISFKKSVVNVIVKLENNELRIWKND